MKRIDRELRARRIAQAVRFIRPGSRVLDIGCHDGELFRVIGPGLREGIGLDPGLAGPLRGSNYSLQPGFFPGDLPDDAEPFDAICALAVLEHIDPGALADFVGAIVSRLAPGGEVVLTVPAPAVDRLLDVMIGIRMIDGMEADLHHGFRIEEVEPRFSRAGLTLEVHQRFQLGLNHLFVFRKPAR